MAEDQPAMPPEATGPADPPSPLQPPPPPPPPDAAPPSGAPPPPPSGPQASAAPPSGIPDLGAPAPFKAPSPADLTKPPRRRRARVVAVIAVLVVVIAGGGAAAILLTRSKATKPTPTSATSPSAGAAQANPTAVPTPSTVSYRDPDAYYTAEFSGAPAYHSTTQSSPVGNVPYRYAEYTGPDVDQLVGVLVFTPGTAFDTKKGLQGIAGAGGGSLISSAAATFQGYPSVEGVVSLNSGDFLKLQILHVGNLAYIIGTAGPVNPPSDYAKFLATVHITPH